MRARDAAARAARARLRPQGRWLRAWLAATVLAVGLPVSPAPANRISDRILAIVNNEIITESEVKAEIRTEEGRLRKEFQGAELDRRVRQLEFHALTGLIERKLQMQIAKQRGHEATDAEIRQALEGMPPQGSNGGQNTELYNSMKEQLTVLKVLEREVKSGVTVTEDEVKRYYDEHRAQFRLPDEYRISQILIRPRPGESAEETGERARHAHEAALSGERFADVATRRSDGPSARQGGQLGTVREGELEPLLGQAIGQLRPGEISAPIQTKRGYHILRMDERTPPRYEEFARVKGDIQNRLYQDKSEKLYHKWISELKDKAYIEVKF